MLILKIIFIFYGIFECVYGLKENTCNQNFYAKTLCIDEANSYKCKCNPGFIWNGQMCVSTALNSFFEFTHKTSNDYVVLEKTFPNLNAFTIATWVQVYNYSSVLSSLYNSGFKVVKDHRTVFSYSLDNSINTLSCQIYSSQIKSKSDNAKKTQLNIIVDIINSTCSQHLIHTYTNDFYWIHLAISWDSNTGQVSVYLNGNLKFSCSNIAKHKRINTAGMFVIGQSFRDSSTNFGMTHENKNSKHANSNVQTSEYSRRIEEETRFLPDASPNENYDESLTNENEEESDSKFDQFSSFVGRVFNLNIWNHVIKSESLAELFKDCRLIYCGNSVQWSDFRQGTRGDVQMKWPTDLIWNQNCFSAENQKETCNTFCNAEIGPVCRESYENNFLWPLSKANTTSKLRCFANPFTPKKLNKYAYRHCDLSNNPNNNNHNNHNHNYEQKRANEGGRLLVDERATTSSWQTSNINECIQEKLLNLKQSVHAFHQTDNFNEIEIIVYLEKLYNLTHQHVELSQERSIHDVSAIIDTIFYLINAQNQVLKRNLDIKMNMVYPDYSDATKFAKYILAIVDMLLNLASEVSLWDTSLPLGFEAHRLTEIVKHLSISLYDFQRLNYLVPREKPIVDFDYNLYSSGDDKSASDNELVDSYPQYTFFEIKYKHIYFSQQLLFSKEQMPLNFEFPMLNKQQVNKIELPTSTISNAKKTSSSKGSTKKKEKPKAKRVAINPDRLHHQSRNTQLTEEKQEPERYHFSPNFKLMPSNFYSQILFNEHNLMLPLQTLNETKQIDPLALLTVYYAGIELLLPNHNKTFRPKDNNVNSYVVTVELIGVNGPLEMNQTNFNSTIDKPITVVYNYLNNFNISDTRCVYLEKTRSSNRSFKWSRNSCKLKEKNEQSATCECYKFGTYTITNDLYDPLWSPPIIENIPLLIPSYFGCIVVSLFGLVTCVCLIVFRARSATTSIHKNLCISVCLSQIIIMISLSRFNYDKTICNMFGILNHYMLFVVFAWLMNEAFNLYITIIYAAHQSSPINDHGSQWRFYLLGYLFPAILVLILLLTKSKDYYDKKICWFNLDNLWIDVSPMIAMITITILVMIISAKEHTESSYTKNQKANKLISNHTKAVWTQIVLLTLCWTFGIMSLTVYGAIIKYIYAFLNCLQGSFLFIFYFLLNEEVRKYLKEKKKQKRFKNRNINRNIQDMINRNKKPNENEEEEDDEDDDEDEDEDEEESEENQVIDNHELAANKFRTNLKQFSNQSSSNDSDKPINAENKHYIKNKAFHMNINSTQNNKNDQQGREVYMKKHSNVSITKSVKFDQSLDKNSKLVENGEERDQELEKITNSVFSHRMDSEESCKKPLSLSVTSSYYHSDSNNSDVENFNSMNNSKNNKKSWPESRSKFKNLKSHRHNDVDDYQTTTNYLEYSTNSGASDEYETNEVKVTVL